MMPAAAIELLLIKPLREVFKDDESIELRTSNLVIYLKRYTNP